MKISFGWNVSSFSSFWHGLTFIRLRLSGAASIIRNAFTSVLTGDYTRGGFAGQVYVMDPPRFELRELARAEGVLGGVAVDGDHNLYVCNAGKHIVQRLGQNGRFSVHCDKAPDGPLLMPNYGSFDAKGNYYFSDSGNYWKPTGRLVRVRSNEIVESLIGGNWRFSNGLAMSPKDGAVFMIESTAADILRIPINKSMSTKPRRIGTLVMVQTNMSVAESSLTRPVASLTKSLFCAKRIFL